MLVGLPPGQDLASRWDVTTSSFVFSVVSLCSLMAGLWSLVKHSDGLYGNIWEDLQCTLASLWVCETLNFQGGQSREQIYFFLIMDASPVEEVAEFEWYLLASPYCM